MSETRVSAPVEDLKFALKNREELTNILRTLDHPFILECGRCFEEGAEAPDEAAGTLAELAEELQVTVSGTARIDFLCNKVRTAGKLAHMIPEGTECLLVCACGLGVQTVAELSHGDHDPVLQEMTCGEVTQPVPSIKDLPVYTAADTLKSAGHHGMALTDKVCGACAQCYLNLTGGICPVIDCAKGLLNGQCGGAKNGKCETDPNKDCAWEKISRRLKAQGRELEFVNQPIKLRDYSKADPKEIAECVQEIREKRLTGFYGGIHPAERKDLSSGRALSAFSSPDEVVIPMTQHIGAPAEPLVRVGDHVKIGQKIGQATSRVSSCVHASISGTVTAVEKRKCPGRGEQLSVVIRNDYKEQVHGSVRPKAPLEELSAEEIVEIVREAGITGMGGAGFPTDVKLRPGKEIDTVLLNGCECEPLLTADHRVLLEYADDVIHGLQAIRKAVGAARGIIVIEENKPDAIRLLSEKTAESVGIEVLQVKTSYPQGAEKMLIRTALGRRVESGKLPADVGVVVSNISTAKAVSDALTSGMPLIERAVSVTGEFIRNPGNYLVRIGTDLRELIDCCGGVRSGETKYLMGGPMMGIPLNELDVPVIKGTNGIIAVSSETKEEQPCIRCGRCVDVCPMELPPLRFAKYSDLGDPAALKADGIMDCFLCGCCDFICSSAIPITKKIRAGKQLVMESDRPC